MIVILLCILVVGAEKTIINDYGNHDTQDVIQRFRTYVAHSGLGNTENYLEELANEWKNFSIHIAITGQSGVGKSTFISTMRALRADDPQAAPVSVKETTKTINSYPDKNNTSFVYWDLPGCGTSNFPRDTYLKIVDFDKFDFLIIITTTRFTEDDRWLVTQAKMAKKPFFLVRNKINNDLESERQDHPSRSEQDVMEAIRSNLMLELDDPDTPIYLLSTRLQHYSKWDFPRLVVDLIQKYPKIKQHAMVLSVASNCKRVLRHKIEALRQRIWIIATLSATANAIPIPGISVACDVALLEREIKQYKKILPLDAESLVLLGNKHGSAMQQLKEYYETADGKNYYELIFGRGLVSYLLHRISTYATTSMAKEVLRYIPIVGQVVSSSVSFGTTFMVLTDVLDDLHIVALKLLYFIELQQRSI